MKSPAPGQNSVCDFSDPIIANDKGLTCSLTGKKLPFLHLACGRAVNYSLWRELQSRTWVLLAGLAHMHICILSSDTFIWSPFYLDTEQRPSCSAAAAKLLQSCPTLCDPIDGSPPGSPVPGILQARTLEWVAISFSNAWKWKVKVKSHSCAWLLETPWTAAY